MVDGLWVDGFVRVVGACGSIYREVFSTRGWFYHLVFLFLVSLRYNGGFYHIYHEEEHEY